MKILGIGEAVVDDITVVGQALGTKQEILETHRDAGGPVLAALLLLAQHGGTCTFATALGDDAEGTLITKMLEKSGISLIKAPQSHTKLHTIIVDAQTGQRTKLRNGTRHTPASLDPSTIHDADLIVMDRHDPDAFYQVIKHKRPDTTLILDPSTEVSEFTIETMRHVDYPIIPIETVVAMGGRLGLDETLRALYDQCQKPIVVTTGELGSLLYDGTGIHIAPALNVEAINTNGAGDIYRGAFAWGLMHGWSLNVCAAYANAAAALQCTKIGNASAVPTKADIEAHHKSGRRLDTTLRDIRRQYDVLKTSIGAYTPPGSTMSKVIAK